MKNSVKILTTALLAGAMLSGLASCGDSEKTSGGMPTLTWYLRYEEQADQNMVMEELNKITEKEIGAHVNIKRIESGDYAEKIKLALSAGETVDICHMAPRYGFYSHVAKGAFAPLDELIEKYAMDTYNEMPEAFWEATKINGKIYGVPNYQIVGRRNGFVVLKDLLDKYNFDLSKVSKLEDIEPFLEKVRGGESNNMIPISIGSGEYRSILTHYLGFESIGSEEYPPVIMTDDDTFTVINQYETEEFKNLCLTMRDWYQKGYIAKEGSGSDYGDALQHALIAVTIENIAPGFIPDFETKRGGARVDTAVIDPPFVNTANIIATMNCIGATSKNPDKAMQFLNLINQDTDGIYNLLCFGVEGVHYNKIGENRIEKVENSGWDPTLSWAFGNSFNAYLYGAQEDGVWEETKEINENATVSSILGFSFDTEPIKTELASCNSVISEYMHTLVKGAVDPEVVLPEFLNKLKAADVDVVIAEAQRQVNEWLANKK